MVLLLPTPTQFKKKKKKKKKQTKRKRWFLFLCNSIGLANYHMINAMRSRRSRMSTADIDILEQYRATPNSASINSGKVKKTRRYRPGTVIFGTLEEVQHIQSCGTVNRVTILTENFWQPKGFAYVEFVEVEAVPNAHQCNVGSANYHYPIESQVP